MGMDTNKLTSLRPLYVGIIENVAPRPRGQHNSVLGSYKALNQNFEDLRNTEK